MSKEIAIREEGAVAVTSPMSLKELEDKFIASLDVRPNSRDLYRRTLKQYFNWIADKGYLLTDMARPQIIEYKEDLLARGLSALTVGSYLVTVRLFYEWAEAQKYYPNIARGVRNPKRKQAFKKQPLTPDQAQGLLKHYKDPRDFALVNLMVRTGLRCIEVSRANTEDITYKGSQRVLLIQGKGRDELDQFVLLTDKAYRPIEEYLSSRKAKTSEPLFISTSNNSQGERLSTRTVSHIAKEALKGIGLDEKAFTAHSLRHTAIVNSRRAGATLEQAQAMARHSSQVTTQIYDSVFRDEDRLLHSAEMLIDKLY